MKDKDGKTALDYNDYNDDYNLSSNHDSYYYLIRHGAHKGIELNDKDDISITENIKVSKIQRQDFNRQDIDSTELSTTIMPTTTTKPGWLHIRYGDGGELRKKRVVEYKSKDHAEQHNNNAAVLKECRLNKAVEMILIIINITIIMESGIRRVPTKLTSIMKIIIESVEI